MPPVFGPSSPSSARLKSWAGWSGSDRDAVGDGEEGDLGAVEELLDDHAVAGERVRPGGLEVVGDDDALARGETVVLDDVRGAEGVEGLVDLLRGRADVGAGGGHARPPP